MVQLAKFVPQFKPPDPVLLENFIKHLNNIDKFIVLTGAGISTESGIPDYRSEKVGLYERSNHRPITHQEFLKSEKNRKRYWARNYMAWPKFSAAPCNKTHTTLASWERSDKFHWMITQNVDGLHTKAGSTRMTELHGSGHRIKCVNCGETTLRTDFQNRLEEYNPDWYKQHVPGELAPDGDVYLEPGSEEFFNIPSCESCNGILKTDVVFFGDNVPRLTVDFLYNKMEEADGLIVLGSSLSVMSGYRFAYYASLQKKPILIVNIGPTRADHLATVKLSTLASDVVTKI